MLISPLFTYFFSSENVLKHWSLWEVLGLRWDGFFAALIFPLLLTMILFLGPLSVQLSSSIWKVYSGSNNEAAISQEQSEQSEFRLKFLEPKFWLNYCQNLLWLRNHVVAPLSEEFTFRACMMPLLLQSFSSTTSILISPLFFGVGEFNLKCKLILKIIVI
jgi:prenyl protein peptidase